MRHVDRKKGGARGLALRSAGTEARATYGFAALTGLSGGDAGGSACANRVERFCGTFDQTVSARYRGGMLNPEGGIC